MPRFAMADEDDDFDEASEAVELPHDDQGEVVADKGRPGRLPNASKVLGQDPEYMAWRLKGRASRAGQDAKRLGVGFFGGAQVEDASLTHEPNVAGPRRSSRGSRPVDRLEAGAASCFTKRPRDDAAKDPGAPSTVKDPGAPSKKPRIQAPTRKGSKFNQARAAARAKAKAALLAQEHEWAQEAFLEFSWRQRQSMVVSAYTHARVKGHDKTEALYMASLSAQVAWRTAHEWVHRWRLGEGFLDESKRGSSKKQPLYFKEEDVRLASAAWWAAQRPRQGHSSNPNPYP